MADLKADFHTHSADDPCDYLTHSSEMLIDAAAKLNFRVLALTCHEGLVETDRLHEYARRRGLILVPGIEACVEGKHVVILNPDRQQVQATSFQQLRARGRRAAAFIAPHPYYPSGDSLGSALEPNIDLFDAIEFCTLYFRWAGFNRKAVRVARKYGLPLIGSSDVHRFPYCDSTHTLLDDVGTVEEVIAALRAGCFESATWPRFFSEGLGLAWYSLRNVLRKKMRSHGILGRRQSARKGGSTAYLGSWKKEADTRD
jgi:hypothetical protein